MNSPAQHIKQEPSTSYGNGPANPEVKQQASLINTAADVAVARAVQALHTARTRARYHAASPSSSDPSREEPPSKRARRSSKAGASTSAAAEAPSGKNSNKGLRHFSVKVCEKVESKGRTTYNEVADELVAEMSKVDPSGYEVPYDEKNIRRRVYDAINVLMAMNIIQKEKKEIIWNGYPNGAGLGLDTLRAEKAQRQQEVQRKAAYLQVRARASRRPVVTRPLVSHAPGSIMRRCAAQPCQSLLCAVLMPATSPLPCSAPLQELIEQQQAIKQLLERNQDSCGAAEGTTALQLPFILVQARPDATVEVQISENMLDVQFDFYKWVPAAVVCVSWQHATGAVALQWLLVLDTTRCSACCRTRCDESCNRCVIAHCKALL